MSIFSDISLPLFFEVVDAPLWLEWHSVTCYDEVFTSNLFSNINSLMANIDTKYWLDLFTTGIYFHNRQADVSYCAISDKNLLSIALPICLIASYYSATFNFNSKPAMYSG